MCSSLVLSHRGIAAMCVRICCLGFFMAGPFIRWSASTAVAGESDGQDSRAKQVLDHVVTVGQLPQRSHLDLGSCAPGDELSVSIRLRGETGIPLKIRSIRPDCGCVEVQHDPEAISADGTLDIALKLSASRKVGRIRRKLAIIFDQARTSPLVIGIDTVVQGPLALAANTVSVEAPGKPVKLVGRKTSEDVHILKCEPMRSTCRIRRLEQGKTGFEVELIPVVAFGSAHELIRLHYRVGKTGQTDFMELPLELQSKTPFRFLPSESPLNFQSDTWRADCRLLVHPNTTVDFSSLKISIERDDGSPWPRSKFRVDVLQTSVVLYSLQIQCSGSQQKSDAPARLKVASPDGELLATLRLFVP